MCNNKSILKILIPMLLITGFFIFSPQYIAFADDGGPPSTEIIEEETPIENEAESEVIKEEPSAEEPSSEKPVIEVKTNENSNIEPKSTTENEVKTETELQPNTTIKESTTPIENIKTESTNNSKALPKEIAEVNSFIKQNTTQNITSNIINVSTENDLKTTIANLTKDTKTIVKLLNDIIISGTQGLEIKNGELTILGENHTLKSYILLSGEAVLNLGSENYNKQLTIISNNQTNGIIDIKDSSILNIYDGITIGPSGPVGMAGGITAHNLSTINMYGGEITNCESISVSGGVYLDGTSVFNMYGGTIKNCIGVQGGAIGLSGGNPIGGSDISAVVLLPIIQ